MVEGTEGRVMDAAGDQDRNEVKLITLPKQVFHFAAIRVNPFSYVFDFDTCHATVRKQDDEIQCRWLDRVLANTGGRFYLSVTLVISVIIEIVSRFDVVAIQEVKRDLTCARELVRALGPDDWGIILTDVTWGDKGNSERLAFVYDKRRLAQD